MSIWNFTAKIKKKEKEERYSDKQLYSARTLLHREIISNKTSRKNDLACHPKHYAFNILMI